MRSKDPSGVLSELTYSNDTFLSTGIKHNCREVGPTLCVFISLWKKMRVYMVCLHKYCLKLFKNNNRSMFVYSCERGLMIVLSLRDQL